MTKKKTTSHGGGAKRKSNSAKTTPTRAARSKTPDEILALWESSLSTGVGSKELDPEIGNFYTQRLHDQIAATLAKQPFDKMAEKATRRVAHDLGVICHMLTLGKVVSKDTFDAAFQFVRQSHPACPSAGGGDWCDIGG